MTIDTSVPFHFKDYRHALALLEKSNFDAAPKAKFLYHVLFELTAPASSLISSANLNLLSVLANTVSLPSYTASVETLNQYNRKKKFQTKIEYKDVNITFYDDNAGVSRSLLESYYKYYFTEALVRSPDKIKPRNPGNTYQSAIPTRFGLDNNKVEPFFNYIKIFQISGKEWFCYTLVNPIISQWSHDELAYAEGAAITENKITVGYEAVLYTNGPIEANGDPAGFAETWYDQEKPPTTTTQQTREKLKPNAPVLESNASFVNVRSNTGNPIPISTAIPNPLSYPPDVFIPKSQTTLTSTSALSSSKTGRYDSSQIKNILSSDQILLNRVTNLALGSGAYSSDWGPANFSNYAKLSKQEKSIIQKDIIASIDTNSKLRIIAEQAITSAPARERPAI